MKTNTTFAKKGIVLASAIILGVLAPAVAPSVLNLNGSVVYAEENIVSVAYHFKGKDDTTRVKVNIAENPNATVGDYYPLSKDGGDLIHITDGKTRMWVYKKSQTDGSVQVDRRGDLLSKHAYLLGEYTQPNNAGTEVKPNNDGNANAGANNNAGTEVKPNNGTNEETHKVTIYYNLYDDPMSPFSSSSSNKVVYVTPNQPLSDHIPETLPGGYVFYGALANRGGSEGESLRSRDALFGSWTNIYVTYPKSKRSGTNPNNAGTEVKPNNGTNANAGTNSNSGQTGWSGSSYYQNGMKVTSKWIFDKNYNSYFYLDASGNYVQNAWVGNYYLKSGGYMAKSEWIYDSNYKSYYYLTSEGSYARNAWAGSYYLKSDGKMAKSEWIYDSSYQSYYYLTLEGSYARNTWVGDYYLKSNGKMAVNERTPDGYQVDASGKWVR